MTQKLLAISTFIKQHYKKVFYGFAFVLVVVAFLSLIVGGNFIYYAIFGGDASTSEEETPTCSVSGINMHGRLVTYIPEGYFDDSDGEKDIVSSDHIMSLIEKADRDDDIKAILLEIDSSGGQPVSGEEIANALRNAKKPTVAVIRRDGLSAAYWVATGADYIFASKNSDVGSVGVTMSYLDNVDKNKKDGYRYIQLSTGKYKNLGDPDKPLTEDEKALIMRDLKIIHQNFLEAVARNRNIPIEEVEVIADGSSMLGAKAKEIKLIDEIGDVSDAKIYIQKIIQEEPNICWE